MVLIIITYLKSILLNRFFLWIMMFGDIFPKLSPHFHISAIPSPPLIFESLISKKIALGYATENAIDNHFLALEPSVLVLRPSNWLF